MFVFRSPEMTVHVLIDASFSFFVHISLHLYVKYLFQIRTKVFSARDRKEENIQEIQTRCYSKSKSHLCLNNPSFSVFMWCRNSLLPSCLIFWKFDMISILMFMVFLCLWLKFSSFYSKSSVSKPLGISWYMEYASGKINKRVNYIFWLVNKCLNTNM